jgi:hypothetical protein
MALELAPYNICVNAIAPGMTDTAQPPYGNTDAELIEMARAIPLSGKMLAPHQIARTIVFLASEDANAITGQVLHVNGGSYMPCSSGPGTQSLKRGERPQFGMGVGLNIGGAVRFVLIDEARYSWTAMATLVGPNRAS